MSQLGIWKELPCPIIGMLHAPALPGAPRFNGSVDAVHRQVLDDADALVAGGVDGLMLENFGDVPFLPRRVPAHVATHMTALAAEVRRRCHVPLGINILRNDGETALAVAIATGAQFIRVNVLSGARVTDQGIIEGIAHDLLRLRSALCAQHVKILADVQVKHSAPLGERSLDDEVRDAVHRGCADGLIVSGSATGSPVDVDHLRAVKQAAPSTPLWIGSGVTLENVEALVPLVDGLIVGTGVKKDGDVHNPVDGRRVSKLVSRARP